MGFKKGNSKKNANVESNDSHSSEQADTLLPILDTNILRVKELYEHTSDLVIRTIYLGKKEKIIAALIYIDGLVDKNGIEHILENLTRSTSGIEMTQEYLLDLSFKELTEDFLLPVGEIKELNTFDQLDQSILSGDTALLFNHFERGFVLNTRGWIDRGVTESSSENVVRGPKEAFTETLRTNTALVRRKIKDKRLKIESKQIGTVTQTDIAVLHISGIANEKIVQEVHNRLDRIDIDSILESGYIEELIEDETYTPFPTVYNSERPDVIAAGLLEGRVAIMVDGTPFVLLVPALFTQFFQSAEDYYQRWDIATLLRLLRVTAFFISLLGPSAYIAITNFHQEMLPTTLLISLASQREGVPFPAVVEALIMEVSLEILREAGVRLPKAIGQTVSIVGALVIGQAAVEAGIVSAAMVIVVSLTAISNFIIPSFSMAISIRLLRFIFMLLAATMGLFGIATGLFALALHLCSLRSFGLPYMSPLAPYSQTDMKDTLWRKPRWQFLMRPRLVNQKNGVRQENTVNKTNGKK